MNLQPLDLTVWPAALCHGRTPKEQCIIAWLWAWEATGKKWTIKDLQGAIGIKALRTKDLDALCEGENPAVTFTPNGKKPHENYFVNNTFISTRIIKEKVRVKVKKGERTYPEWVPILQNDYYQAFNGFTNPRDVVVNMSKPIKVHGVRTVRSAFSYYASETGDPAYASWKSFARQIGKYV